MSSTGMWSDTRGWDIEWEIQTQEICLNRFNTQPMSMFSTVDFYQSVIQQISIFCFRCMHISDIFQVCKQYYLIIDGTTAISDHRHKVSTQVSGFCKYPVLMSAAVWVVRHCHSYSHKQLALQSHIWYHQTSFWHQNLITHFHPV